MKVKLRLIYGENAGHEIVLAPPDFVLGRQDIGNLCPTGGFVSRRHCKIVARNAGLAVLDLESRNGTFLNGELVESERQLKAGDVLRVGPVEFEVLIEPDAASNHWLPTLVMCRKTAPPTHDPI